MNKKAQVENLADFFFTLLLLAIFFFFMYTQFIVSVDTRNEATIDQLAITAQRENELINEYINPQRGPYQFKISLEETYQIESQSIQPQK